MVNVTQNVIPGDSGVTVPGHLYGLNIEMPGIVGADTSAGVNVNGLRDSRNLAFHTPRGRLQTDNGDIVTQNGTVSGTAFLANGSATWTAGSGEPSPDSCGSIGSLYSRTDGPDANHVLYVCTSGGWVAK